MAIFKRGRVYWFHFYFNGQHIQRSTRQGNLHIARQVEAAHRTALAKGEVGIRDRKAAPFFDAFAEEFLRGVRLEKRHNTRRCYETCIRILGQYFKGERLDRITAERIQDFRQSRLADGRGVATVNRYMAVLRILLRTAVTLGKLDRSPFEGRAIKFPKEPGFNRIVSFAEEHAYLKAANGTLRDVATLMLETGMRPEEVFNLRQDDLHLSERHVHIRDGKTENAKRDLFLTEAAYEVLKRRLSEARGPYLFPKCSRHRYDWNQPMVTIQKAHELALKRAGINPAFRLYDLRHTYGTRAAESGVDPLTLMKLMGHADLKTTQRYVHLSKRHLAEAQKKLEIYRVERMLSEIGQEAAVVN